MSNSVTTSAGLHIEVAPVRGGMRARVLATLASAVGTSAIIAGALVFADVEERARCEAERDGSGVGRAVALRALDAPEHYQQFLYRVTSDGYGYRAVVVVKSGPFVGDAWERDAEGRVRHNSDVCRDASFAEGDT